MKESLLTIPINEVFEATLVDDLTDVKTHCGCPFCRMRDTVENHICEYIMGAAMMEPDVRMETNAMGFCRTHYGNLLQQNNRLSLGLMLSSHLDCVRANIFAKPGILTKDKRTSKAEKTEGSCFVCAKVDWGMDHMVKTFFALFSKDAAFRELFARQEFICMPHYAWVRAKAESVYGKQKGDLTAFTTALDKVVCDYIESLSGDVKLFCNSFDYRNAGMLNKPEMEHVRTAVNRSINFLTGRPVT